MIISSPSSSSLPTVHTVRIPTYLGSDLLLIFWCPIQHVDGLLDACLDQIQMVQRLFPDSLGFCRIHVTEMLEVINGMEPVLLFSLDVML